MDFILKQWRDQQQQHESEDEHQQNSAKIPKYLLLDSPQQHHHHQHQQQQQEVAALPLFVSSESQDNKITNTHLSVYPDHHSSTPPTAIPTRFPRSGGRYSFSLAQWQELELQALIYRHMVAGASVPAELLQLVKKSLFTSSNAPYYLHHYSPHFQPAAALLQAGYWGKGAMDPEPGRCRRTDGKKWRCSRDVVAGHKYCERHMHRGRNRSRKPVEFPAAATATASVSASNALVGSLNKPSAAATAFAAGSAGAETRFSLSRSGASSLDAFHLNPGSSDNKALFGPQHESSSASGDGGKSNANSSKVLMQFFDDWPRSDNGEGNNLSSSTGLSISTPGNPTSDFLRLSTGNGDEQGLRDSYGNDERERAHQLNWSAGGWGANPVASMGGPLAEALRSSSNSSPTSVLHQLPRCSAPDTNFVSA
ncbi:growth-regulating factor 3-like isoform X2 [Chenopodium quinoa]|uniref:growth-regulating factor 3-like isoform X2 n=1 Tax=Chenopodium quinoa TaxID=63459 RepID=UPI000B77450F|nr:growth-regulating factor 3-like isoform X2 [Chenopodium quinoa]